MKKILVLFSLVFLTLGLTGCASVSDYCIVTVEGGTGGGNYEIGSIAQIDATIPSGQQFMYWEIDGEAVSANESYIFKVEGTVIITAVFAPEVTLPSTSNTARGLLL